MIATKWQSWRMQELLGLLDWVMKPLSSACLSWTCLHPVGRSLQLWSPFLTVLTTCQKGGKNAEYIGQLFKDKVAEFDPTSTCTDEFFFDNASNVQQAGEILCATYPRAFCFHGDKHFSLYFLMILLISNQSKWVCKIFICPCYCCLSFYFRISFSKHAGCIMCLGPVQVTGSMHNLWHKHLLWTMEKG